MTDYEAAFRTLTDKWHESVQHYEDRIEKLERENNDMVIHFDGLVARIRKLEKALREIRQSTTLYGAQTKARKALDAE
jgi:phage shock protein A